MRTLWYQVLEKCLCICLGKNVDDNEVRNFNNITVKSSKEVYFRDKDRKQPKFEQPHKINMQENRLKVMCSSENNF